MKKKIALVTGGYSQEYQISLNSSKQIARALDSTRYDVFPILITREQWMYHPATGEPSPVDKNDFSILHEGKKIQFDAAFIAIHGAPGEDGQLEGYLDMLNIPYTCSGRLASALTFNKMACKQFLAPFGFRYARTVQVQKGNFYRAEDLLSEVDLPCFVKPNEGGSSFGISKVTRSGDLPAALEKAFGEDDIALVETFLEGTEITCGLMKTMEKDYILPVCQIVSKNDFFDFEAKYTPGMADEIVPARIPDEVARRCQEMSSRIYSLLNCRGLVRIDYIWTPEEIWFMEVNTIPGLSAESIVPKMIRAAGLEPGRIFGEMVEDCIRRKHSLS
ncbi:MAG: D-alanine--D-alanine ligase [Bacteroidales bacterium]